MKIKMREMIGMQEMGIGIRAIIRVSKGNMENKGGDKGNGENQGENTRKS